MGIYYLFLIICFGIPLYLLIRYILEECGVIKKSHLPVNPLVSIKDMMMIGFLRSFWVEEVVSREAVLLAEASLEVLSVVVHLAEVAPAVDGKSRLLGKKIFSSEINIVLIITLNFESYEKTGWIILGVVVLLVLWGLSSYNGIIGVQEQATTELANVQTQYQRRADMMPQLAKS